MVMGIDDVTHLAGRSRGNKVTIGPSNFTIPNLCIINEEKRSCDRGKVNMLIGA